MISLKGLAKFQAIIVFVKEVMLWPFFITDSAYYDQ